VDWQGIGAGAGVGAFLVGLATYIYNANRNSTQDIITLKADVEVLKSKMGLFWRLVEDNLGDALAKANPIHLTPNEQAAAETYKYRKGQTPTEALKLLNSAITRELAKKYMSHDEATTFTLVQGAIQSQLLDRGQVTK
jgi:hypothetical protein